MKTICAVVAGIFLLVWLGVTFLSETHFFNPFLFLWILFGILAVIWDKSPHYYRGHNKSR